ncbi:efflux transporter periplasmic adaptor subunit, partial [Salmonella enterica subsp. enterica serovar Virchow]|nr:efflux transporter periplasmic adaptor subunit [Salmonella enterica subsp. enterica serovar Virchow]
GKLSPGQFVQVRVELTKEDNVIAIPETALVSSLYGDFVYVVKPAKPAEGAAAAPNDAAKPADASSEAAKPADAQKPADAAKPADAPADAAKPADAEKPAEAAAPDLAVSQVFVTPGRRARGIIEVLKGLNPGDEIVTAGQNKLSNNTPVKIDNSVQPMVSNGAAGK